MVSVVVSTGDVGGHTLGFRARTSNVSSHHLPGTSCSRLAHPGKYRGNGNVLTKFATRQSDVLKAATAVRSFVNTSQRISESMRYVR